MSQIQAFSPAATAAPKKHVHPQKPPMRTRTLMLIVGLLTISLGYSITVGLLSWQSAN